MLELFGRRPVSSKPFSVDSPLASLFIVRAGLSATASSEPVIDYLTCSENTLLNGLQSGESAAIVAFFKRYEHDVRGVLGRILGANPDLSDALQDTFIRAYRSSLKIRDALALRVWLRRVATSVAFDHLRKRQRLRWNYSSELTLVDERTNRVTPEIHAAYCDVHRVLEKMPRKERVAFCLRYIDEMELKEIAVTCNVSLATVKRRLARAETRFETLARRQPGLIEWMGRKSA